MRKYFFTANKDNYPPAYRYKKMLNKDVNAIIGSAVVLMYMFIFNQYILEIAVVTSLALIVSAIDGIYNYIMWQKLKKQRRYIITALNTL